MNVGFMPFFFHPAINEVIYPFFPMPTKQKNQVEAMSSLRATFLVLKVPKHPKKHLDLRWRRKAGSR